MKVTSKKIIEKTEYSKELTEWWIEHQEIDKKREREEKYIERKEKLRTKALNKLTLEEKKILGIK